MQTIIDKSWLEKFDACREGINWYEQNIDKSIAAKELIDLLLKTDDLKKIHWTNWLLSRLFSKKQKIQYAIYAAELVLHLFENKYPNDKRPREAIEAAKKYLNDNDNIKSAAANAAAAANAVNAVNAAYAAYAAAESAAAAVNAVDAANAAYAAAESAAAAVNAVNATNTAYAAAVARKETLLKIINYGIELLIKEEQK